MSEAARQMFAEAVARRAAGAPATIEHVAAWFGISKTYVRDLIKARKIAHWRAGKVVRIDWEDADKLLGEKREAKEEEAKP